MNLFIALKLTDEELTIKIPNHKKIGMQTMGLFKRINSFWCCSQCLNKWWQQRKRRKQLAQAYGTTITKFIKWIKPLNGDISRKKPSFFFFFFFSHWKILCQRSTTSLWTKYQPLYLSKLYIHVNTVMSQKIISLPFCSTSKSFSVWVTTITSFNHFYQEKYMRPAFNLTNYC